jgi:peptidase M23-like protein
MEELFYGAYLDQGSRDYNCGAKYYSGHRGTDILLRNFRVQDSGVTVVAAAAGRVMLTHDGEPDRNSVQNGQNDWNVVQIAHPDGITSIYGHLRRGSILVNPGQDVTAGTPLGLVGSSGFSNWPHLHFEVRRGAVQVDPWDGPCQIGGSLWASQLAYQSTFRVLDLGVQDRQMTSQAELLERPLDPPRITGANGVMSFWVELYNVRAEILRTELHDPAGTIVQSAEYQRFLTFSTAYALATYPVTPDLVAGRWKAVVLMRPLGGSVTAEVASVEFELQPVVALKAGRSGAAVKATMQVFTPGRDSR